MSDAPENVCIWFAENGKLRKWSLMPFAEGQDFVRADLYEAQQVLIQEQASARMELVREVERLREVLKDLVEADVEAKDPFVASEHLRDAAKAARAALQASTEEVGE